MRCGTDTHRDYETVVRRVKHEGLSFLMITLPDFCRDFESCLEQGSVDSTCFQGFRRHGSLPKFLQGLTSLVFDRESGKLLNVPSEDAVLCVRQVCLMYKKLHLPCSTLRERKAFDDFVKCENDLDWDQRQYSLDQIPYTWVSDPTSRDMSRLPRGARASRGCRAYSRTLEHVGLVLNEPRCGLILDYFQRVSRLVWASAFGGFSSDAVSLGLVPRHGPGATAERILGNQKYVWRRWHHRLDVFFPFDAFASRTANVPDEEGRRFDGVEFVEPGSEQPVRVISVPKTMKGPRIIAIEPVCMQYVQQALSSYIVERLGACKFTSGQINFTNQRVNRDLAFSSSIDRSYGTIDLSEASDRVHAYLVHLMLQAVPLLREMVFACRSTKALLPDGREVVLQKFASMGSALCFPMESMVFFTLCVSSRLMKLNLPVTVTNLLKVSRSTFVYGDDIIVPADEVPTVTETLEAFGLKVNRHKTFYRGNFRESCGMDAFSGVDVTPVYLRKMPPWNRQQSSEFVSYVSFANQLYKKGWWTTAKRVREDISRLFGELPYVQETSPCLGYHSFRKSYDIHRWDSDTHSWKVKGYVLSPRRYADVIDGDAALMKFFLTAEHRRKDPLLVERQAKDHLTSSVRRDAAIIKRRWVQPY